MPEKHIHWGTVVDRMRKSSDELWNDSLRYKTHKRESAAASIILRHLAEALAAGIKGDDE